MPQRIQRQRTKGWRMPEGAVYVGRPSRWGNPYVLGAKVSIPRRQLLTSDVVRNREYAVALFRSWLQEDPLVPRSGWNRTAQAPTVQEIQAVLAGKDLACWCPLDQPCHADVLLRLANGGGQ